MAKRTNAKDISSAAVGQARVSDGTGVVVGPAFPKVGVKNPTYFPDPINDNLLNIALELGAALWVVKDRLRVLEDLLAENGVVTKEAMERHQTPPEREAEVKAQREAFISRIYGCLNENAG